MNHIMHFMEENAFTEAYRRLNDMVWEFIDESGSDWNTEDCIYDLLLVLGNQAVISVDCDSANLFWSQEGDCQEWVNLAASNDVGLINRIIAQVEEFEIVEWDLD